MAEVFDIWDHNLEDTLHKVNSLINVWSKRRWALPDKITVIKSLILSKCTHIFLALPNPQGDFQKLLERKLYKFLWNNGPDRICRKNIVICSDMFNVYVLLSLMYLQKNRINKIKLKKWLLRIIARFGCYFHLESKNMSYHMSLNSL